MNKFLIAAGAGALLIVAQTAVSAAYNPLDRVSAAAKVDVTAPAPAATATIAERDYTAFADTLVRADAASDEVKTARPANEPVVADRVSGEPTSYNSLITQATTQSELEAYAQEYGEFLRCGYGFCGNWAYIPIGSVAAYAAYEIIDDGGDSD